MKNIKLATRLAKAADRALLQHGTCNLQGKQPPRRPSIKPSLNNRG